MLQQRMRHARPQAVAAVRHRDLQYLPRGGISPERLLLRQGDNDAQDTQLSFEKATQSNCADLRPVAVSCCVPAFYPVQ